jgi:hypothetical protein
MKQPAIYEAGTLSSKSSLVLEFESNLWSSIELLNNYFAFQLPCSVIGSRGLKAIVTESAWQRLHIAGIPISKIMYYRREKNKGDDKLWGLHACIMLFLAWFSSSADVIIALRRGSPRWLTVEFRFLQLANGDNVFQRASGQPSEHITHFAFSEHMFWNTHMASVTTATGYMAPRRHQEERHKKTISPYEAILSSLRVSNCQLMNGTIYDLWGTTCKHSSPPSRPSVNLLHIPDSFFAQTNVANHQYARAHNKPKMNLHRFERIAKCQVCTVLWFSSALRITCVSRCMTPSRKCT